MRNPILNNCSHFFERGKEARIKGCQCPRVCSNSVRVAEALNGCEKACKERKTENASLQKKVDKLETEKAALGKQVKGKKLSDQPSAKQPEADYDNLRRRGKPEGAPRLSPRLSGKPPCTAPCPAYSPIICSPFSPPGRSSSAANV